MNELSEFQSGCDAALQKLVTECGNTLEQAELRIDPLDKDTYALVRVIAGSNYELWIYDDEAQIQGAEIDLRFESPDYSTPEELRNKFLESVKELIAK